MSGTLPRPRRSLGTRFLTHFASLFPFLASLTIAPGPALAAAPGDTLSVVTLQANFDSDNPNAPPNVALPGAPAGDFLTLGLTAGTIQVVPSYDGLSRPVEIRQLNVPGVVSLNGFPAPIPAPAEKVTVRWRSVAKDDEAIVLMTFGIRASNGATLASIEYLHQGGLSYNGLGSEGAVLPVTQANKRAQLFTVDVDFLTRTTNLSIDGTPVPGFQNVPFAQAGDDVAQLSCYGEGSHPQTVYVDDLSMVARYRVPDRPPVVSAPASLTSAENTAIAFTVTASDPDAQAIASLTSSALPTGASFVANGSNTSGDFAWTPGYTQAGSYSVTFTAANALSGSATTNLTITNTDRAPVVTAPGSVSGSENSLLTFTVTAADPDGDAMTSLGATGLPSGASFLPSADNTSGTFSWTPGFGQSGSYVVGFTASAGGLTSAATTSIAIANVDRAPSVAAPAAVDGEEGGILAFDVTASDPDGDAIGSLTADLTVLPAGHGATFTPAGNNASGTFRWPMQRGQAGVYDVAFTATAGGISGTATTRINVAFAGTTVTGELTWTPQIGQEGAYTVTFTATNGLGETGSGTTTILVTAPVSATTAAPSAPPPSNSRNVSLSPDRALKGPIVSVTGLNTSTAGTKTTVSATASDPGTSSVALAALRGVHDAASTTSAAQGIVSFTADLSGLPAGHDAIFVVDQEPVVTAPASFTIDPGTPLSFTVGCADPDGDAILGLGADLAVLPSGNTATFASSAPFTSGTFAWTPRPEDAGTFAIEFTGFNALVGKATTSITVRAVAPASIFQVGTKKIRLSSNKPFGCLQVEPIASSFSLFDVNLPSIRMVSPGTGSVSEIAANVTKAPVIGDRDNDLIPDMQICFDKAALRALFSNLRGSNSVPVIVKGSLLPGGLFQGTITLDIQAGGGALQTVLAPNPLNPSGTLSFITRTAGPVRVSLFDLNGRLVRTLWRRDAVEPGAHEIALDARGSDGRTLTSGVYFYRIESREGVDTGRFTVLK